MTYCKKRISLLLLPLIAILAAFVLSFSSVSAASNTVIDRADIFTESEESKITARAEELEQALGITVTILTDPVSTENRQTYAETYYYSHNLGSGENHDGILLYICMNPENRGWWTHVEGTYHTRYTEKTANQVDDNLYEYLSDGEYGDGVYHWLGDMESVLKNGKMPVNVGAIIVSIVCGVVIAIIAFIIVYTILKKSMKPVQHQMQANQYLDRQTMHLENRGDIFLHSTHVRTKINEDKGDNGGGSSFSSSDSSSGSGRSF